MGRVLTLPTTRAQQALARLRLEEDAFRAVLEVLAQWNYNDLVVRVFAVYRTRLRTLRRLAGGLLDGVAEPDFVGELRRLTPARVRQKLRRQLTPEREP
jgi:hypothetical protein